MITTTDFLMDLLDLDDTDDASAVARHLAADVSAPDVSAKTSADTLKDEYDTRPEPTPETAPMNAADAVAVVRHLLADVSMPPAGTKTPTDTLLGLL